MLRHGASVTAIESKRALSNFHEQPKSRQKKRHQITNIRPQNNHQTMPQTSILPPYNDKRRDTSWKNDKYKGSSTYIPTWFSSIPPFSSYSAALLPSSKNSVVDGVDVAERQPESPRLQTRKHDPAREQPRTHMVHYIRRDTRSVHINTTMCAGLNRWRHSPHITPLQVS